MLTLIQVINSVEFTETEHSFIVPSFVLNERLFAFLKLLNINLTTYDLGSLTVITEFGYEIDLSEPFEATNEGNNTRLSITKTIAPPVFFSISAFKKALLSQTLLKPAYRLTFEAKNFKSFGVYFYGRSAIIKREPVESNQDVQTDDSKGKYIKSINDEAINFLPLNIDQWLVNNNEEIPEYWKETASAKLLAYTGSELFLKNNLLEVTFRGDRRITVIFDLQKTDFLQTIFKTVNIVCQWVYTEGKDIDTRQNIFNNQISSLSISDVDHFKEHFVKIVERVLENSVLAYRYYLVNSNKELNKSLIEINKTLFEHINKIRQNTTDLVSGLWRDFTSAFGLLILNFSLKKPDLSAYFWDILLFGMVIYLIISYYLSSSVGFWFYRRLKRSLTDIRVRIYGYLTETDFDEFAIRPLKNAQNKFIRTFWIVLLCYLAIIILVLWSITANTAIPKEKLFKVI